MTKYIVTILMSLFLSSACTEKNIKEKQNNDTSSVEKENRVSDSNIVDTRSNEMKKSIHTTFVNSKVKKHLLEQFDFSSGDYTLIGFESNHPDALSHLVGGRRFTKKIAVLNELKDKWIVTKGSQYGHYDYEIHICKSGVSVMKIAVKLTHNILITDEGEFYFDFDLGSIIRKMQTPKYQYKSFESLLVARKYYHEKIKNNDSIIWREKLDWLHYTGTIEFRYKCKSNIDCYDDRKMIVTKLEQEIKKKYLNEEFELYWNGGSSEDLNISMKCNKSLANKFNLYPINRNWKEYSFFSIESYWEN